MTRAELLQQLTEMLELDIPLQGKESLADISAWDSMAVLGYMALLDNHNIACSPPKIAACATVEDLLALGIADSPQPNSPGR